LDISLSICSDEFRYGSILAKRYSFTHYSEISVPGAPSFMGNVFPPVDPIKSKETMYLNGHLAFRRITYLDGTVEIPEGDTAIVDRATIWTYVIASGFGLLGGLCGWYIARKVSSCPVPAIESPPPSL
jgi:hypothetical protein